MKGVARSECCCCGADCGCCLSAWHEGAQQQPNSRCIHMYRWAALSFPPCTPPPLPREPFYNGYSFWLATLDRKDVPCTITVLCYFQVRAGGSLDQSKASHAPWLASQSCHSEQAPVMSWQSDTHCNTSVTLSITSLNTQYTYTYIWISGSINIYIWMYLQLHWFIIYVYNHNSYVTRGTSTTYVYMYNHSTADTLLFLFRPFYV